MIRSSHRLQFTVAVIIIASLLSFGALGSAATSAPVTISVLDKWPEPEYAPYFQKVVADYQSSHPNVTINLQAVGDQPYKDKIRVLTAAGALPDVFFSWAGDFAKKFVRAGLAADLTSAFYTSDWHTRFGVAPVKAFTYNGRLYGMPINIDAKFFVYNTAIFGKYHLSPPKTLGDLYAACSALKQNGMQPIAFGNQYGWPAIHYLTTLNSVYVPQATLDRDYTPETGQFTDPGYVQALTTFKQINDQCLTPQADGIAHGAARAQFQASRAAMMYVESQEFPYFTKSRGAPATIVDNWSYFEFPAVAGARGAACLTGAPDGFMVSSHTKHMDVAIDFLKFFSSKDNAELMTKMLGWASPVIGSATEQNAFTQLRQSTDDINRAKCMGIWLDTVTHSLVAQAYLAGTEGLVNGTRTPQQVMSLVQAAAKDAQKAVQQK